jgi:8-oxo-dGTP pyrophosphatase MutT (NUDIX family)
MRVITRDIVAALLFSSDGKLLLGQSDPAAGGVYSGNWVIPGGGVEPGESRLEALRREILEETGLDIAAYEAVLVDDTASGRSEKTLKDSGERVSVAMNFIDYEVRLPVTAAESGAAPTEELVRLQWFTLDELKDEAVSPPTIDLLKNRGYLP